MKIKVLPKPLHCQIGALSMASQNHLTADNIYALKQGLTILDQMDDQLYSKINPLAFKSGIGGHFRHCLDFYHNFLSGIQKGQIDYDQRQRDPRVQEERLVAYDKFKATIEALTTLPFTDPKTPVLVKLDSKADPAEPSAWSHSTLYREMQFLLSHTIHHYALIAIMLRLEGFEPSSDFGVAPSTIKYWQKTKQNS
jgi:uncharacterized damage-inducible protein DinB